MVNDRVSRLVKSVIRNPKDTLLRWLTYFKRGHNAYLVFLVSFANFIVIQYRLLIQYIPALEVVFTNLTIFAITFFMIYIPTAILIGWQDYKRFAVPMERRIGALASPWAKDLARALTLIAEGRNEEAVKVLEKWAK